MQAGSSETRFQNGWKRDRDIDGNTMRERICNQHRHTDNQYRYKETEASLFGMTLDDFCQSPARVDPDAVRPPCRTNAVRLPAPGVREGAATRFAGAACCTCARRVPASGVAHVRRIVLPPPGRRRR